MYCVCRRTIVVRSCIYFCSVCACYHLRVVFSKNLASTGHRQLCGPETVFPLKIPLIITHPPPRSLPPHLAGGNGLHCFHSPWFWHFLRFSVVFDVIWRHLFERLNILMSGVWDIWNCACNSYGANLHYVCRQAENKWHAEKVVSEDNACV